MEYRRLGASGFKVPVLSFGTGTFGGKGKLFAAWGATDTAEARRLLDICLDAGVSMFDTADIYSAGESERILGEAMKGKRDRSIVSTKATFRFDEEPNNVGSSRQHLLATVDAQLKRLQTDYIDLFQLHGYDAMTPPEEVLSTLDTLVRAGKVRFLIGSSDTMGTGVNAQLRLKALHHLDVPWLPSQIEQREGRILRQGNQHDVIDIFAYATEGSLDASMWQNNERKARFIAAALSGDTSIRRLEDIGEGQANQFALAKAIASGDQRLMQKAGLEADIARLERQRAAHIDDQHAVRRQVRDAERDIAFCTSRIAEVGKDIERLVPTAGDAFAATVAGKRYVERKEAGRALMKEILTLVQLQQEGDTIIAWIGGFLGRLRLPGRGRRRLGGAACPACGRPRIGQGPCPCGRA